MYLRHKLLCLLLILLLSNLLQELLLFLFRNFLSLIPVAKFLLHYANFRQVKVHLKMRSLLNSLCFISAGARFTITLWLGNVNPEFFTAERTLSLASFTAISGSPTMIMFGSEFVKSTSTSIL